MINTPRLSDLILKGDVSAIKETMEDSAQYGMRTFDQALFELWNDGKISEIEALRNADSANNLRLKMKMATMDSESGTPPANKLDGDDSGGLELSI